jgi:hypothetical protein
MEGIKVFLFNYISTVLVQLFLLFGPIFLFGLFIFWLNRISIRMLARSIGARPALLLTGFIGVPVHELGHAFFCMLFFHRIKRIRLFDPNGLYSVGSVEHYYHLGNWWQVIGNYFIGTGPIIFGCFIIVLLINYFVPGGANYFESLMVIIKSNGIVILGLLRSFLDNFELIINMVFLDSYKTWQFWVFLFIGMNISIHMDLSPPDIRGATRGFFKLLTSILIFNLIYVWAFFFIKFNSIIIYIFFYNSILLVSLIFSLLALIVIFIISILLFPFRRIFRGRGYCYKIRERINGL